jgi:hypothetical protein
MMNISYILTSNLLENDTSDGPITPEEKARRKRMLMRLLALGAISTALFTHLEVMISNPTFRKRVSSAIRNFKLQKAARRVGTRASSMYKNKEIGHALGTAGVALAVEEPLNVHIANKLEDRRKKKMEGQK